MCFATCCVIIYVFTLKHVLTLKLMYTDVILVKRWTFIGTKVMLSRGVKTIFGEEKHLKLKSKRKFKKKN